MAGSSGRGPLGSRHNSPVVDSGTLARSASPSRQPVGSQTALSSEKVRIRFSTLEIFAAKAGGALGITETPLTSEEKKTAKEVFGDSVDLDTVRILVSPIVNAPTTLGNYIRAGTSAIPRRILIHELSHVWQFQTKGMSYVSDSAYHQTKAWISTGSRSGAYNPRITPGKSIHDYTAEEQAVIIENFYAYPPNRQDSEYKRMINEVRQSRPLPEIARRKLIIEEAAFGPGMSASRFLSTQRLFEVRGAPEVPLIRIEF